MKISVVIPSRDRAPQLEHALRTVLEIADDALDIVVSGTAGGDTQAMIDAIDDPRLAYAGHGAQATPRQRFETALQASTGDYVTVLGDDDGILGRQLPFLRRILAAEKPDVMTWTVSVCDWKARRNGKTTATMRLRPATLYGKTRQMDAARLRADLLSGNPGRIMPWPGIRHGCVSREFMNAIRADDGPLFNGAHPELYFSCLAILKGGTFIHADHPFTISGQYPVAPQGHDPAPEPADDATEQDTSDDSVTDVMGDAPSQALALFSSLETARDRFPDLAGSLDYAAWYGRVLTSAQDGDAAGQVRDVLKAHADKTGTQAELSAATPGGGGHGAGLRGGWDRIRDALRGRKMVGGDTILGCARTLDGVLGDDMGAVLDGRAKARQCRAQAWTRLKLLKR